MANIICPNCGKTLSNADENPTFCSFCGNRLSSNESHEKQTEVSSILQDADRTEDPVKKHALLLRAQAVCPDDFQVERELLFLGRLYERGGRPDFSRMPYWPLDAYGAPQQYTPAQRHEMITSFFNNLLSSPAMAHAPDPNAFFSEYLSYMARKYIAVFIAGRTVNNQFFGVPRRRSEVARRCAADTRAMLTALHQDASLTETYQDALDRAIRTAFSACFPDADESAL